MDLEQYFECTCHSDEHRLVFHYDPDDGEVYLSTFLETEGFLKRLWLALKYVLGYKCRYGHFGCWILARSDLDRLIKMLETYRADLAKKASNAK